MKFLQIHLETIDSTNSYAKREHEHLLAEMQKMQADGACIFADMQTKGRGRNQRAWLSPPKVNLYVTFYFRLRQDISNLTTLAQLIACSFCTVLEKEGLHPQIKWPNDIQLNGKKMGGVLCELLFSPPFAEVFLGIGINVNMDEDDLKKIDQKATSLKMETGRPWDQSSLLSSLQTQLGSDLFLFAQKGYPPFRKEVEKRLAYRGEKIVCSDGQHQWEGICDSIGEDGSLNLKLADGTIRSILSADLTRLGSQ